MTSACIGGLVSVLPFNGMDFVHACPFEVVKPRQHSPRDSLNFYFFEPVVEAIFYLMPRVAWFVD